MKVAFYASGSCSLRETTYLGMLFMRSLLVVLGVMTSRRGSGRPTKHDLEKIE
jgi:hypothetical protein